MPKDKGGLALIIGTGKPKSDKPTEEAEPKSDKADAMRDLGEALSSKDWDSAALAFERAYEICAAGESSGEDEESEEGRY